MQAKIWAHRGACAYAPENTLEAFGLAAEMGADGVELDVYLTADGKLAVHHDGNASRMTNGACSLAIMESSFAELRKSAYSGAFAGKYPGAAIPTLAEVFGLLAGTGMTVNVELKAGGEGFAAAVLACAADFDMGERVIYSSFNHGLLRELKKAAPGAAVAPLWGEDPNAEPWEYAREMGAAAVHPSFKTVLAGGVTGGVSGTVGNAGGVADSAALYIAKFHSLGIKVNVWTANDSADIKKLSDAGADAIITNVPDVALAAVGR